MTVGCMLTKADCRFVMVRLREEPVVYNSIKVPPKIKHYILEAWLWKMKEVKEFTLVGHLY